MLPALAGLNSGLRAEILQQVAGPSWVVVSGDVPEFRLTPTAGEAEFSDPRLVGDWVTELPNMVAAPQVPPWCSYTARIDERVVGFGGFKGQLDETGQVEIGFLSMLPERGRGVATAICAELVAIAFANGAAAVRAHTLPEIGPSTRLLRRHGFSMVEELHDTDDGLVWRWCKHRQLE